jgi:hypothetical protein
MTLAVEAARKVSEGRSLDELVLDGIDPSEDALTRKPLPGYSPTRHLLTTGSLLRL